MVYLIIMNGTVLKWMQGWNWAVRDWMSHMAKLIIQSITSKRVIYTVRFVKIWANDVTVCIESATIIEKLSRWSHMVFLQLSRDWMWQSQNWAWLSYNFHKIVTQTSRNCQTYIMKLYHIVRTSVLFRALILKELIRMCRIWCRQPLQAGKINLGM